MIRTLLVDDESPARDRLRTLLSEVGDVEICGEARDGIEALERIDQLQPDLVFLDIQMPGLTGLEVVGSMKPPRPHVVFLTAYDRFAVDAFDLHAVDYLMKPTARHRLVRTLDRVRDSLSQDRDQADAADAQQKLLSPRTSCCGALAYTGAYRPARNVGGDYYDFLQLDNGRVGLALGDIAGKGTYAGILMASLQARLQALAPRTPFEPGALAPMMSEINCAMLNSVGSNRYASLFYGVFDAVSGSLHYVNAGHPPGLLLRQGQDRFECLSASGTVVGLLEDATWVERRTRIANGDLLVVCSDGVLEALGENGEDFGEERWHQALLRHRDLPVHELRDALIQDVLNFAGSTPQHDDLSLIVARAGERESLTDD